jgi:hypothetical protein
MDAITLNLRVGRLPAASAPTGGQLSAEEIDANFTGLKTAAEQLDAEKADVAHGHAIADVTGLQAALDGKIGIAAASYRTTKDSNGLWTVVGYRRADNTRIRESTLSGGTSPLYTTRTERIYDTDGTTVLQTLVFTLAYTDGELVSEDLA